MKDMNYKMKYSWEKKGFLDLTKTSSYMSISFIPYSHTDLFRFPNERICLIDD